MTSRLARLRFYRAALGPLPCLCSNKTLAVDQDIWSTELLLSHSVCAISIHLISIFQKRAFLVSGIINDCQLLQLSKLPLHMFIFPDKFVSWHMATSQWTIKFWWDKH